MNTLGYDLSSVPEVDPDDHEQVDRYADRRAQYLTRVVDLPERVARALAYRELGYSHAGIAKRVGYGEGTVDAWMADVADRFGERALETRPQSDPVEVLQ